MNSRTGRILTILIVALGLSAAVAGAEPNNKPSQKPDGTAAGKGAKSSSPLLDKIREVGNEASQGIHRATQGIRDIGDKAGKKTKDREKGK